MIDGATPLMYACQQGQEKECLQILAKKPQASRERDRTKKTPLHYCAEKLSTKCAEALLKVAPDTVNAQDEDGYTPLHLGVIAGNKPFIQLLLNSNADINALDHEKHSVVHWATVCGEEEALEMVLRAGAMLSCPDIHGGFPLHYAAQMCGQGDARAGLAVLRTLLSYNANVDERDNDGRQPILWAASAGSAEAILALVKAGAKVEAADKDGLTALHCAASRGHTDCLETLIALCGAHVDTIDINGCTALFYAVTLGHADATQLLLSLGAEPNRQDRKGRTPAHCGAAKGQLETLRLLLSGGSNLWLRNVKGDVPLHEAVASGRCELVTWLLNTRPEAVNVANNDGKCPIHVAAINNNLDIIKVLLDAGSLVNPVLRSNKGEMLTPLDVALVRGHRSTAKYLQMHGGVPRSKLNDTSACLRGTMLSRDTACGGLLARKGPPAFDVYPMQLSVQASQQLGERFVSGTSAREKMEQIDTGSGSNSSKKKLRKRRSDRKQDNESSSEDSEVSSSCSRQHRKSGGRRRHKTDKRKSKSENVEHSSSENSKKTESEDFLEAENKGVDVKVSENALGEIEKENASEHEMSTKEAEVAVTQPAEIEANQESINQNPEEEAQEVLVPPETETPIPDGTQEFPDNSSTQPVPSLPAAISNSPPTAFIVNPDSSLEENSPTLPEIVTVEAEVYQVDVRSTQNSPDDTRTEENTVKSPSPPPDEPESAIIVIHSPPAETEDGGATAAVEEESDSVVKDKSPPQHASSTDTSSQAEDEMTLTRPVTARRRSIIPNDAFQVVDKNDPVVEKDEVAFYTLPDDLSSERRSADGSEGLIGEDTTEKIPVSRGRRQSLAFDNNVTLLESDLPQRRKSEGQVMKSTRRASFMHNELDERNIFARDFDVDTAIKDVLLADSHQRSSSVGDESGASTRNDDSSVLIDSGIEPSPRRQNRSHVPRLCHRNAPVGSPAPVSVTRAVQSTIRKYHLERKIFYQLLELKRMQIRAGCANEQVLVKRLVDDYQKAGRSAGLTLYGGNLSFRQFERFLYEQLHRLQAGRHPVIAKVDPSDDLESLSKLLHKKGLELGQLAEEDAGLCTHLTHRCRHAAHAYTGIPCAAYITKFNHHTMPKETKYSFLPKIHTNERKRGGKSTERPVTLEVINGKNKQIISLPTNNLDRSKRYFVTFTIKGEESTPRSLSPAADTSSHYHAKTV